jgi:hypothetical protein
MKRSPLALLLVLLLHASPAAAGVRRVWATNDGEKIERGARGGPGLTRNSTWDGRSIFIFGARNEIVAFQVIVEADGAGVRALSIRLPELRAGSDRIVYQPPSMDPTDYVGRPIQIFAVHYMHVATPSHASWVFERGSPAAPADPTGWKPVQLVPENARAGRGGLPIAVRPNENQSIWIDVYIGRDRRPGRYRGSIDIDADGARRRIPIELQVFDFTLPDENSMHAMLFYTSDQPERYHGRNLDPAYHRLAHRYRVELVDAYDEQTLPAVWGRFAEGGKLHMEMRVKRGRGYVSADKNFDEDLGIGWIPIDSVHSPVKKVNYLVEAARLGQTTDYDKLTVDVWTNGSVTPRDAVSLSAKLIRDHLNMFINLEDVGDLQLSVRSYNCLKNANIRTIRELVQKAEGEMLKTKNFGRKSLNKIKEILSGMGLSLGMRLDQPSAHAQD